MDIVREDTYCSESSQYLLFATCVSAWTGIADGAETMRTTITREWQFAGNMLGGKKDNLDLMFITISDF